MSLVDASEHLVALPQNERRADAAAEDVIVVEGLRKRYGATEAVAGINLHVARGEIFAFLGPNGAAALSPLSGTNPKADGRAN